MIIISFEGLDSCGKATQSRLLADYLKCRGCNVKHVEYPDYTAVKTFHSIEEHLKGEKNLNSVELELYYALNKRTILEHMQSLRDSSRNHMENIMVVDRYKESQYAYAGALGFHSDFLKRLNETIPDSNLVIYLNVDKPYNKETKDIYENDKKFQDLVRVQYDKVLWDRELLHGRESVLYLRLTGDESVEDVFYKIVKGVDDFLNIYISRIGESC